MGSILIGLIPALGWGFQGIIMQKIGGTTANKQMGMVLTALVMSIVVALVDPIAWSPSLIAAAAVNGIPWAIAQILQIKSFDYLGVSRAMPLTSGMQLILTSVIGAFYFNEWPHAWQMGVGFAGIALIIVGTVLTTYTEAGQETTSKSDIRKGVINGACKKIDRGKVVASFLLGSQDVYSFIDHNPDVLMKDIKYTNDPWIIAQNPRMMAINSATEVDLTGQICADSIGTRIFSGTGGQLDFVKGATMSEGGISITAFASRTNKGKNKIVPTLNPGAGVVTPRADAHWIVTEYGAVDLTGKSLQERAKLLTSIAHPDDREMLERAAFERFGPHYYRFGL